MTVKRLRVDDLSQFDTFLFDADGVLWRGSNTVPGSVEFIEDLRKKGKQVYVITNNSTKTRPQYQKKLMGMGFNFPENHIISPGITLPSYLKDNGYEGKKIYLIGTPSLRDSLEDIAGVKCIGLGPDHFDELTDGDFLFDVRNEENVAAVVIGFDGHFSYPKLMRAANYLKEADCGYFITNEDYTFPGPCSDIVVPGTGCITASVRAVTDREPLVFGKPHSTVAEYLQRHGKIDASRTIMFGDRLDTDILFANRNGFSSCLMLTGIHSLDTVERAIAEEQFDMVPQYQFSFAPFAGR
ncbi:unnamed protein product, partial [Mesorhabditis spiculigera]